MKAGARAMKKHYKIISILKLIHIVITLSILVVALVLWMQYKSIFECGRFIQLTIFSNILISAILAIKNM